jgi:DNA-binding GntR family transcriptional regulator
MARSNPFAVPLNRREAVTAQLRADILSGRLAPGEPITDAQLAERLNVSITPVREAVAQLVAEGLIVSLPNKRRQVAVLTSQRAVELTELIGLLMTASVKRAAPRLQTAEWSALLAKVDKAAKLVARSPDRAIALLVEVSDGILDSAANAEISAVVRSSMSRIAQLLALSPGELLTEVLIPGWHDALTHITEGDVAAGVARLEEMFATASTRLADNWETSVTPRADT